MHVAVDHSWHDKQNRDIVALTSLEPLVGYCCEYSVLNIDVRAASAIPANDRTTLDAEIIGHRILGPLR